MSLPTITDPFAAPDPREEQPRGAIIELLERHNGPKRSYTGVESLIVPNHLRINGVAVYATEDDPVTIHETVIDGSGGSTFAVTVQMMARALHVGATPSFNPEHERQDLDDNSAAVIEVPDVDTWAEGDHLDRRWVLLNGHRVWTTGKIVVGRNGTHGLDWYVALVTVTLLCRQLIVDDQPAVPPAA